jgi:hypothetical protein
MPTISHRKEITTDCNGEQFSHIRLQTTATDWNRTYARTDRTISQRHRKRNSPKHINNRNPNQGCSRIKTIRDKYWRLHTLQAKKAKITRPLRPKTNHGVRPTSKPGFVA